MERVFYSRTTAPDGTVEVQQAFVDTVADDEGILFEAAVAFVETGEMPEVTQSDDVRNDWGQRNGVTRASDLLHGRGPRGIRNRGIVATRKDPAEASSTGEVIELHKGVFVERGPRGGGPGYRSARVTVGRHGSYNKGGFGALLEGREGMGSAGRYPVLDVTLNEGY